MKNSPIVTHRDARLSLWTSIVESQMKKKNPDLSIKEVRNLPTMQGVFAHVSAAAGNPIVGLNAEEKKQQAISEEMYKGVSTLQLNTTDDIAKAIYELANFALGNADYDDILADYGIRTYSDQDYGDWAIVAVEWVIAVNAKDLQNGSIWHSIWQSLKDINSPVSELVLRWCGQASDTAVQKFLAYRKWHDSSEGLNYSKIAWTLPNNARVVMLGDWGTSLDDAREMLKYIWLLKDPHAFVHLGDIYYSGTQEECEDNFLNVFRSVASEIGKPMVPVFTIPGNHEYYSFGDGYFWLLDNLNTGNQKQSGSYFCLRTQDQKWQFLAMDTGQDDNNPIVTAIDSFAPKLMGDRDSHGELAWHVDKLKNFNGQTILLSHHQLFSRNAAIDEKVQPYFSRYLHSYFSPYFHKIAAWFWGHEHSYAIYKEGIYGLAKGRLLGSSSYEVPTSSDVYTNNYPLVPYDSFAEAGATHNFYDHVCAVMDFTRTNPGDPINVEYFSFPSWGQNDPTPSNLDLKSIYLETIGASTMKSQVWSGNSKFTDVNIKCQNTPALCTDNSKIYMAYRNDGNDNLHCCDFDISLSNPHDKDLGFNIDHSPAIVNKDGVRYILFSDKDDDSKLSYIKYESGAWGSGHHINDASSNNIKVGSGISAVWMGSTLYVAFVEKGTDNIRVVKYNGSTWSYTTPGGNPESDQLTPGLAVSNNVLYLIYADKNNGNHIAYMTYNGSSWSSSHAVNNGVSGSTASSAYPKAHDNISAVTEADGKVTAYYRGKDNGIFWLTYDPTHNVWYGGVSLPRINDDKDVPMTSDSAGSVGLSNGVFLAFSGKSSSDIRWVRRTDS
jgi:hypothetical protein